MNLHNFFLFFLTIMLAIIITGLVQWIHGKTKGDYIDEQCGRNIFFVSISFFTLGLTVIYLYLN